MPTDPTVANLLAQLSAALTEAPSVSPTSTPPSPTPSTTPTPSSDESMTRTVISSMTEMMTTALRAMETATTNMREMAVELVQGRSTPDSSSNSDGLLLRPRSLEYNYDETPLAPGIEAIIAREQEETELARLRREHGEIQDRIRQLQLDERRSSLLAEDGSPNPWRSLEDDPRS